MATTFTRLDVEDVLSSIRKLVSDVGPDRAAGGAPNGSTLFLLTPAHRIAEDTSRMTLSVPADDMADDGQDVGILHGETGDAGPLHLGTPVFVRAQSSDTAQVEPQDSGNGAQSEPLIIGAARDEVEDLTVAATKTAQSTDGTPEELAQDETELADPFAEAATNSGSLEMRAAELEIAVSHEDEQWEPDGSEAEPTGFPALAFLAKYREHSREQNAKGTSEILREGEISGFVSEALNEEAGVKDSAPTTEPSLDDSNGGDFSGDESIKPHLTDAPADAFVEESQEVAEIEAEIDAEEIAIEALTKVILDDPDKSKAMSEEFDQEEQVQEPISDEDAVQQILRNEIDLGTPEDISEDYDAPLNTSDEAQPTFEPAATAAEQAERPMPVVIAFEDDDEDDDDATFDEPEVWSSDDDLLVDEDVLRRVVADIVRDELQGRLGERITRNVRRMVRREIEKALSTRHLE